MRLLVLFHLRPGLGVSADFDVLVRRDDIILYYALDVFFKFGWSIFAFQQWDWGRISVREIGRRIGIGQRWYPQSMREQRVSRCRYCSFLVLFVSIVYGTIHFQLPILIHSWETIRPVDRLFECFLATVASSEKLVFPVHSVLIGYVVMYYYIAWNWNLCEKCLVWLNIVRSVERVLFSIRLVRVSAYGTMEVIPSPPI